MKPFLLPSSVAIATCTALSTNAPNTNNSQSLQHHIITRRSWLAKSLVGVGVASSVTLAKPREAIADIDALPTDLRKFTALAPLGEATSTGNKITGLSLSELANRLSHDLVEGSTGKGGYFISGDISTQIFRDDCEFTDPTNSVSSLSKYQNALRILFNPEQSFVQLLEPLEINEPNKEITAKIRSGGTLKLPWNPRISSYESIIKYKIDDNGLIESQIQEWSIPASQALKETFTPSVFNAPYSNAPKPPNEPKEVTELYNLINGHRPESYSQEKRFAIAALIDQIADSHYEWHKEDLSGKWALAYLQPGPEGGGIDRRIPFPDLPFNNNYQIFSTTSVTNVGELIGPLLQVRVGGSLVEENENSFSTPKRFRANINGGSLCVGDNDDGKCLQLPISGEGIFDGVYLGERLRIGQNINGGGARVVQVKIA